MSELRQDWAESVRKAVLYALAEEVRNPHAYLKDDGAALRLAIMLKLQITVAIAGVHVEGLPVNETTPYAFGYWSVDSSQEDRQAIVREAICLCAQQIGDLLP